MRSLRKVVVTEAIIHILEKDAGKKIISERTVPLKNNENLSVYFEKLIQEASEEGAARAATFSDADPNEPFELCMKMFRNPKAFIPGSKVFGEKFYQIMESNKSIGDGDLVVCRFNADSESGSDFLAIMKLLPVGAYRNVQKGKAGSGQMYVDLEVDPFIFPKDINVLQKVALISKPPSKDRAPDVLFLDKQDKRGDVAKFFKTFLDVEFVRDNAELTLNLYNCLIHSLNDMRETLTPALDKYLGDKIYQIFTEQGIAALTKKGFLDLYEWAEGLVAPPTVRSWFAKDLKLEFQNTKKIFLDLKLVERYTKQRAFYGQVGSKFHVETGSYNDLVQSVRYVANQPGVPPYFEVLIHTSTWREDTKR
ncbi:MAG: nucleoid-associated protein [Anaerolineales bacterium]|nr:nucleoid-associated protein [Anaerolineales bacterium]